MAASPPPSSSAIPPSSSSGFQPPPPPSSLSPPPAASVPPISQPNATPNPPTSSTPPPPSSPPPQSNAPPPSIPSPPPSIPASPPPPVASTPPTSPNAPPPTSPNAPPPTSPSPPPPTVSSPPPPTVSSPPPSVTPSTPTLSPPPSASPPPTLPSSPPPSPPAASPPPPGSPPVTVPPPSPSKSQTPPPPPSATPPTGSSQPPPLANPPAASPPPPVPGSPPPSGSLTPPSNPSAPPPKKHPPSEPSAPPPKNQPPPIPSPPGNSSSGATPAVPSVPSPPGPSISPPVPSPTFSSGNPTTPNSPGSNRSSDFRPNITAGQGGRNSTGGGGIKTGTAVSIAVVAGLLMLSLVGVAVWFVRRRRRQVGGYNAGFVMPSPLTSSQVSEASYPKSPTAPLVYTSSGSHGFINSSGNPGLGNSKSWFTYEELHEITSGFSTKNLLGEGGFGCVYKGCLSDGREVAVKQLKVGGGQGEREFKAEVEIISRVHHRHLVSLVGYCISDNQRLLVYDFVPNDTLDFHLHGEGRPVMDWATRVRVAAGAARGIAYLHEDCHPRIIHRDIKSSNILIDNNFEAQVADFGLAKLAMDAATHVTTRVMGTFGYMAPEYASTGKLTDRSDVYSFGVVLLELITGRKPVDASQPMGDESLVEWARPMLTHALDTGDFEGLPDPRLEKNYNESEMFRMIEAAAACVRHSASMRPRMGLVVRALDSLAESDLNNGVKPGQSELFAAPQSAEIRMFQRMAFGSQDYSSDFSRSSWKSRSGL